MKAGPLRIGVDVDGILADHLTALIPRLQERHGIALRWEEATQWQLPLGASNISAEFVAAMEDLGWVAGIPPYPDAVGVMSKLVGLGRVVIVTARPQAARDITVAWLKRHRFAFHEVVCGLDVDKGGLNLDFLVDDYTGNIRRLLVAQRGVGVLVDRPWNRDGREELAALGGRGRFRVVQSFGEVVDLAEEAR